MKEKPLVSIVVPTYGRPNFLKRCIDSILEQTYKNIEIIIVDDNDPDTEARIATEKVMHQYEKNSLIIYLQHDKNRNGSAARNTGWKRASGKYITFIDDDDEISEKKIEKQVECLEKLDDSWGACYTGYRLVKEHGQNQISTEKRSGDCYVDALMRTMFMGSGSNLFLRKKVVDEINGYDESFIRNQDIEFMARALEHHKLAYIDEVLLTIHQEGERKGRTFEEIEKYTKHYLEKFSERIEHLEKNEKKRVVAVISLERFRIALYKKRYIDGIKILKENHVSVAYFIKYIIYLMKRVITKKSYGFKG